MNTKSIIIFLFFSLLFSHELSAQVKLSSLFSDDMILQQQSSVAIWGWSQVGSSVNIEASWDKKKYTATTDAGGKWKVNIQTPKAGGPYELTIKGKNTIVLHDVLIGEVWLCAGQSNMEEPMKGFKGQPIKGSNDLILKSKNKNIRLFTVGRSSKASPQDTCKGRWQQVSPEVVSNFSATGYLFGKLIYEMLDIPVGLISVAYGGSCIQAWMSKETSLPFEDVKIPEKDEEIKTPNRTPTALYNGMLHPVIGFGIRGCIYYQGETNYKEAGTYVSMFSTMVNEWRTQWNIGQFPFYYTQIAPFNYSSLTPNDTSKRQYAAFLRDAQRLAERIVPNSHMAVLLDAGERDNIHPADKETPSKRLAYIALAKTYGITGFGYASPTIDTMTVKDSLATITFRNIPNGITSYGKDLTTFEIAGADHYFYPAKAVLGRKSITVSSPLVKTPVAVRYAFKDYVVGEVFSTEGLPLSSFRTDNWDY
jgi:sialate O-acetylesterase